MRWPWLTSALRTLRFRLTLWNSFVVITVGLATLYAVRVGVRYTLVAESDATLKDELAVLALALTELYPDGQAINEELQRLVEGHRDHNWFLELSNQDGEITFASDNFPTVYRSRDVPLASSITTPRDGDVRILQRVIRVAPEVTYKIRLGTGLEFVEQDVDRLTRTMVPIFIVLIVAAPLGGYVLARQATAPIRQIIETTKRLRPSQLQERLKIRGTGDELDLLGKTINRFLDVIAGYLRQHQEFVGNAAHELRSPLTAIRTNVDVALSRTRTREEYEELLEQVSDECSNLTRLVNQLLVLAENESTGEQLARQPLALDQVALNCLDMLEAVAEDRDIELISKIEPNVMVLGEPSRFRQVVVNLIDNALKFTPSKGRVTVSVVRDAVARTGIIEIADSGCGIDPNDLPRLFERFYRAERSHQRRPGAEGSGLGLSICHLIIERYGGSIDVRSPTRDDGTGTTVRVTWPLLDNTAS
ncbi:MAG: HAMP domain-containing protein [Planctomycetales bacterium]|nr:HAMP domain-containing protein [Planctomycetales bacterium]